VDGTADASVIFEDERVIAIVPLHAPYPESALVFPKVHIDHFTDLPEELAAYVMRVGFELAKKIKQEYGSDRIGMGVHGYGIPHAHFNVFPQQHELEVVFSKMAYIKEGEIRYGFNNLPVPSREKMDEVAQTLKISALDEA
jgi:histidine triad (HIT) family protein